MIQQLESQSQTPRFQNRSDVPVLQAANFKVVHINGVTERALFFNCTRAGTFSQAFQTLPCQIKLANAIKLLDKHYVTDQCLGVVAGPLQALPTRILRLIY
jgi:hypothetical protein